MSKEATQTTPNDADLTEQFKELLQNREVSDIESVIKNLNVMADVKRKESYLALYNEFEERVIELGFAGLPDFMVSIEAHGLVKTVRKERKKVDVRYIDTENSKNTWTGRGKKPLWLKERLEKEGRSLDEFLVTTDPETEEQE